MSHLSKAALALTFLCVLSSGCALLCLAGCKPAPAPDAGQASPQEDRTPQERPGQQTAPTAHRPSREDLAAFLQATSASYFRLPEVKMDIPTTMPNTSPADNVWLCKVKLTYVPTEDLVVHPTTEDAQAIDALVNELNALINWRNLYVQSPYAKACGGLEVNSPVSSVPQLLVVSHPKGQPLAPVYGTMAAEWQVDHWQFSTVDLDLSVNGRPRREFTGETMVKGSPEAEAFLRAEHDAITRARKDIDAIRRRYAQQVARGTRPGAAYQGRVSFRQMVLPCELRFLDPPPGADEHFANFEVRLPDQNPPCVFTYSAKIRTELPIPLPSAQPTPANPYANIGFGDRDPVPRYNVSSRATHSTTGKVGRESLPAFIAIGNAGNLGSAGLLVLDGHAEGTISEFVEGIHLSAQQTNP